MCYAMLSFLYVTGNKINFVSFRKHFCRLCNEYHDSWRTALRHEKLFLQGGLEPSNPLIDLSRRKRSSSSSKDNLDRVCLNFIFLQRHFKIGSCVLSYIILVQLYFLNLQGEEEMPTGVTDPASHNHTSEQGISDASQTETVSIVSVAYQISNEYLARLASKLGMYVIY